MEILGIFRKTESESEEPSGSSQPGWRRFLSRASSHEYDDNEFRPEVPRPKPNYYRMALGASLTVLVVVLGAHVAKLVPPVLAIAKEELPSPTEQIQAVLANFHLADAEVKRPPAKLPDAKPRKKHRGGAATAEAEVLPPYKGTVRAELKVTPINAVRPFQVELKDTHRREKLEVTPKALTIDIDDPQPAMLRETAAPDPSAPAAFTYYVDLTGPEADRVADVIAPERNPEAAKKQHVRSVGLIAVVDRAGHVSNIKRVNGSSALAQAAIDTVRRARYQPYYENGRAVEMETGVVVNFTIPQS